MARWAWLLVLLSGCAHAAADVPDVRVVQLAREVEACDLVANVSDDDLDDMMEKAAKRGGTHVLIVGSSSRFDFPFPPKQVMNAQVYRCK